MSATLSATAIAPSILPPTLPLFPLEDTVLLPRAKLPLTIFEPRYLAMVDHALGAPGRMIGMIQPNAAADPTALTPSLYQVGCAGRIVAFNEIDDGRCVIVLLGVSRFTIAEEILSSQPYRMARPDWRPYGADLDVPSAVTIDRARLLAVLRDYFKYQTIEADWDAVEKTPDELLVSSLVMSCPLATNERQALLEAPDLATRAAMLTSLLEMAAMPHQGDHDGGLKH